MKEIARISFLLILAILYFLVPYDLIPDKLGKIGRVDDLILLFIVIWWSFFRPLFQEIHAKWQRPFVNEDTSSEKKHSDARDPLEAARKLLGVNAGDDMAKVKKAYRDRIQQYHPDLVANMGPELREMALTKTQQLNSAFDLIKKNLA